MYLSKEEREELSNLSKEVYGTRNHWHKLVTKGHPELVTRKIVENVPGENGAPPTVKESSVPYFLENGAKQFINKYYTVESVKAEMLHLKKQREEIMAAINKQNEELKAKAEQEALVKKLNEDSSGSAV